MAIRRSTPTRVAWATSAGVSGSKVVSEISSGGRPVVARRRHADEDRDGEEGIEYRGQRDEKAKVVLVRAH